MKTLSIVSPLISASARRLGASLSPGTLRRQSGVNCRIQPQRVDTNGKLGRLEVSTEDLQIAPIQPDLLFDGVFGQHVRPARLLIVNERRAVGVALGNQLNGCRQLQAGAEAALVPAEIDRVEVSCGETLRADISLENDVCHSLQLIGCDFHFPAGIHDDGPRIHQVHAVFQADGNRLFLSHIKRVERD